MAPRHSRFLVVAAAPATLTQAITVLVDREDDKPKKIPTSESFLEVSIDEYGDMPSTSSSGSVADAIYKTTGSVANNVEVGPDGELIINTV